MAADDVGKALVALKDGAVRERVRSGDESALGVLGNLTPDERELVQKAAEDDWDSEVSGFGASSGVFEALDYVSRGGVSRETAGELDEVLGFDLDWAAFCKKCKKDFELVSFNMASLTTRAQVTPYDRPGDAEFRDPGLVAQDPSHLGL